MEIAVKANLLSAHGKGDAEKDTKGVRDDYGGREVRSAIPFRVASWRRKRRLWYVGNMSDVSMTKTKPIRL